MRQQIKECQNCKKEFTVWPEDISFYEKVKVPLPTFCWLCRAQRRFTFRNERVLYKRKSDFSGKEIFSMYSSTSPVKVYEREVWLSDQWDPMEYGMEYDFSRSFFEQLRDLLHNVPLKNLNLVGGVNSEFSNHATEPKNSYLVVNASHPEDCCYGNGINESRDCFDVAHVSKCEECYEVFWLNECSASIFSSHCNGSYNLMFCKNCNNCHDCFGCVGLRSKSYHIFNKPYSKSEYEKEIKKFDLGSYQHLEDIKKKAYKFWLQFPNKFIEGTHNEEVSGNYIDHSKNVLDSFLIREGENLRYCQYAQELPGTKDCYDYSIWGDSNERLYESCSCGIQTYNLKFCLYVQEGVHDIEYSIACTSASDLFGCIGLRRKQYCILNKQYTKEAYEALVPKIIQHMHEMPFTDKRGRVYKYGEFFPVELSPVAYNETIAQEYFPLTKEKALEEGYTWKDVETKDYKPTVQPEDVPDHIKDVQDVMVGEIFGCVHGGSCNQNCTIAFRIIPQELRFYKKWNLPLPRLCPSCRHHERLKQRTGLDISHRECQCVGAKSENGAYTNTIRHFHGQSTCPNEFETNYAHDRPEIVYCEQCYLAEVA